MGLFSAIKNLFRRKRNIIERPLEFRHQLAYMHIEKKGEIHLGKTIVVDEKWVAFLVANKTILDYFGEGEYKLDLMYIPKCAKKLNLHKANKDGVLPHKFKADVVFLNLNQLENIEFENLGRVVLHHKHFKGLHGIFKGKFDFKLKNPAQFLKIIFMEMAIIKNGAADEFVKTEFSEIVTKQINKKGFDFFQFDENENLIDFVINKIQKESEFLGMQFSNVEITQTKISQRSLNKIDKEFLTKNKSLVKTHDTQEIDFEYVNSQQSKNTFNNQPQNTNSFAPQIEDFNTFTKPQNSNFDFSTMIEGYAPSEIKQADEVSQIEFSQNAYAQNNNVQNVQSQNNNVQNSFGNGAAVQGTFGDFVKNSNPNVFEKPAENYQQDFVNQHQKPQLESSIVEIDEEDMIVQDRVRFTKCPKCNTHLSTNAKVCHHCGYCFPNIHRCEKCGAVLYEDELICTKCGTLNN